VARRVVTAARARRALRAAGCTMRRAWGPPIAARDSSAKATSVSATAVRPADLRLPQRLRASNHGAAVLRLRAGVAGRQRETRFNGAGQSKWLRIGTAQGGPQAHHPQNEGPVGSWPNHLLDDVAGPFFGDAYLKLLIAP